MTPITLAESVLHVIALQAVLLGVCTSVYIVLLLKEPVSKESIPVACLIQQEGTLMSVLGYIVMTIPVSSCYCACTSRSSAVHLPALILTSVPY